MPESKPLQWNRLFALKSNLLDRECGEIFSVPVVRNAEYPVAEFQSCLDLSGKPIHTNRPDVKWNRVEPGIFLVCGCDREENFGRGFFQDTYSWQKPRE